MFAILKSFETLSDKPFTKARNSAIIIFRKGVTDIKKILTLLSCLIVFAVLLCSCTHQKNTVKATKILYDTVITVELYDGDEAILNETMKKAEYYQKLFDADSEESDIYKINHSGSGGVSVSNDTAEMLTNALAVSNLSDGAFDITVKPIKDLWNFSADNQKIPSDDELKEQLPKVGYDNVEVDGTRVTLKNGAQLDVGAVAKGYIADKLAEFLRSRGCENALIKLGGNIYAMGKNKDGKTFSVGIQKPFAENGEYAAKISELSDMSVVTSGNYIRYFEKDGKIYHHILDTKSGYPIDNGISSVTIISSSSATADALSTACFALGERDGLKLVNNSQNAEAVFITSGGKILLSDGLKITEKNIPEIEIKEK